MARDIIHNAVNNALIKDGWTITSENFQIKFEEVTTYADIAAERAFAAERGAEKIAVEVKSFLGASLITEFEKALGQYQIYRRLLSLIEPERKTFLAISSIAYDEFFTGAGVSKIVAEEEMSLIVVRLKTEEIIEWINWNDTAN